MAHLFPIGAPLPPEKYGDKMFLHGLQGQEKKKVISTLEPGPGLST